MKKNKISKKLIAVVGPTAGGKTSLGVFLAKKYNGEIVSADSRQVYCRLDVGTGKEGRLHNAQEFQNPNSKIGNWKLEIGNLRRQCRFIEGIPQWLIDICEPEEEFTMFDWLEGARKVIDDIFARGKVPIIVGGTGLYVQSLLEGFELTQNSKLKTQNCTSKLKKYSREELEKMTLANLQSLANKLKPKAHNLDMNNTHRLIRAIERAQSGQVMTKKKPDFAALQITIDLPREELYKRIDQRVDQWFEQGFIEEVQGLLKSGVDPQWLMKIGLEYRILTEYLLKNPKLTRFGQGSSRGRKIQMPAHSAFSTADADGSNEVQNQNEEFEAMKQEMKFAIHAFARRQLTWFRRFPEINWVKDNQAELLVEKFL